MLLHLRDAQPIVMAVANLDSYSSHTGIGRVLHSLRECWGERVRLVPAWFESVQLPILRNNPHSVLSHDSADLILLPQLTGAQALRDTRGVPAIVIVHDVGIVDFPGDRDGVNWITNRSIRRSLEGLRHADHIVTVSDFTKSRLLHHLPDVADRVTTIHDGVGDTYLDFDEPQHASRLVIESHTKRKLGEPLLIYVGTEHPRKDTKTLLEALSQVKNSFSDAQLLKVGRAGNTRWREQTLRAARQAGIQPDHDLLFLEGIDDQLLAHAYRAADVFVSASLYEGFGLPALEATAVGTPVVVTNQGAFPEVVGRAGWIVDAEPDSLARAVLSAVRASDRDERVRLGRLRAETLRWSNAADRYLELIGALLAHGRRNEE